MNIQTFLTKIQKVCSEDWGGVHDLGQECFVDNPLPIFKNPIAKIKTNKK